jgi:pimeloyl-ACP methyl ester carboxylesterase
MTVPFRSAALTMRAAGIEAAALAGHLLFYPAGLQQESWPLHRPTCDHLPLGGVRARGAGARGTAAPVPAQPTDHPLEATGQAALEQATAQSLGRLTPIPGHAPVLLLHGLVDNRSVFALLRRSLHRNGYQHVHALNYSPLTMDIRTAAVLLGRHVRHTRRIYGGERVAVIGHSLGGLIARYYVQCLGGAEDVHTVITLGTPHQGTHAARLPSVLPIVRQLRPGSPLLTELNAPAPGIGTRFVAIWGDLDQLVLPPRNARIEHPDLDVENVLIPGVGHVTLPMHPRCAVAVRQALSFTRTATEPENQRAAS